jgi:hypothetical protein
MPKPNPVKRRTATSSAATRLQEALTALTTGDLKRDHAPRPTVSELCRLASVSRNSLYRYHLGILKALRKHQCRRPVSTSSGGVRDAPWRSQIEKLSALVDHYYTAYREASVLLARRERELSDLRRTIDTKPALVKT